MNTKHLSIAIPGNLNEIVAKHLIKKDLQEDLCFALWFPSEGATRKTALIGRLILPRPGERERHGNVSFTSEYLNRAVDEALKEKAGLALMHSHLGPGWQGMSEDDEIAEQRIAPTAFGATGLPFVGLTLGTDGAWSGRFWARTGRQKYERRWCETIRINGSSLEITFDVRQIPLPIFREEQERTISAWGEEIQAVLGRLTVGIVGAGSVGSIVAESLARTGIGKVKLIDFDEVERKNLDRLLHATKKHIGKPKVNVLAHAIRRSATAKPFEVEALQLSVTEEKGFREALDCDILFSCVDRPWPRYVLNYIAYTHLIHVIDGGIHVGTSSTNKLIGADWKSHIVGPGRACLECLGQYDPALVSTEREGYLDDPKYIQGLAKDHVLRGNENVFAFSLNLASLEVLQMLSTIIVPCGISDTRQQTFHFVLGELEKEHAECQSNCWFSSRFLARGDTIALPITGLHFGAERMRNKRKRSVSRIIQQIRLKITS